jgi:hypothetical protein
METFNRLLLEFKFRLDEVTADFGGVMLRLAIHTIVRHPLEYLETVAQNLYAWVHQFALASTPDIGSQLATQYDQQWPVTERFAAYFHIKSVPANISDFHNFPVIRDATLLPFFAIPPLAAQLAKLAFGAIWVAATLLWIVGRADRAAMFCSYLGTLTLGGTLLVSSATVFIPRYAIPLDPLIIMVVCVGTAKALLWLGQLSRSALAPSPARERNPLATDAGPGSKD